jgi:hypothetical protein
VTGLLVAVGMFLAAIPAHLPFRDWFVSRGVRVEIARSGEETPWIRGTTELPAPPKGVAGVVTDFRAYQAIFAPAIRKADVLESGASSTRLHVVWPYPFPLRNRDAVIEYQFETAADGTFVLAWSGKSRPGDPREGVRIERVEGETRVAPLADGTSRVTYTYLGDLGGKFPRSAAEKAWRAEPVEYFRALRRRLGIPDLPK